MSALEDTAEFVRKIIESATKAGARIDTTMMDREFFSAGVMAAIDAMGIGYLVPRRNTDTVVCALGEFAAGAAASPNPSSSEAAARGYRTRC